VFPISALGPTASSRTSPRSGYLRHHLQPGPKAFTPRPGQRCHGGGAQSRSRQQEGAPGAVDPPLEEGMQQGSRKASNGIGLTAVGTSCSQRMASAAPSPQWAATAASTMQAAVSASPPATPTTCASAA
jgi:hypothetical protein